MSVSPCFCGRVNAFNSWSRRWSKRSPSVNHRDKKELRGNEILQKRLEGMRLRKWGASTQKNPTKVSCFSHEEVFYAHLHRQEQVENKRLKWQTSHQYDDDCYTHTHTHAETDTVLSFASAFARLASCSFHSILTPSCRLYFPGCLLLLAGVWPSAKDPAGR